MAQNNRDKELWLVPKRVSLHQTICLIDGIVERNYDGTIWNESKQNNLGVNLKNWGATKDGKNISHQSIRTLLAALPQYLGFVYIDTSTTPHILCVTEAGFKLLDSHKDELKPYKNLKEAKLYDGLIEESDVVLHQMEKLQITNPIIAKDCENILLFPFRFVLKVLFEVGYLDIEEIAMYILRSKNEDELELIVNEINNFRSLTEAERISLVDSFKKTQVGNITLVQAPSARYFISLCETTGLIVTTNIKPNNYHKNNIAIKIKNERADEVAHIVNEKYSFVEPYDFGNNLALWIEYIGNVERLYPPIDVTISNLSDANLFYQVFKDNTLVADGLIKSYNDIKVPMFIEEEYEIKYVDVNTGKIAYEQKVIPTYDKKSFQVKDLPICGKDDCLDDYIRRIKGLCESKNFDAETLTYLKVLEQYTGLDKSSDKALRGAYLEYDFFKLLQIIEAAGLIENVVWYGKCGKYGLPTAAPGGKMGTPDIRFDVDDVTFILELTTIKAKSAQFSAEASSVPDHIRLYKHSVGNRKVCGIFSAPIIHQRVENTLKAVAKSDYLVSCITTDDLVEILTGNNRKGIKEKLLERAES